MNEERFKNEVNRRWGHQNRGRGNVWTGVFLLVIGGLLLARTAGFFIFPVWFFTWPVFLIGLGLFLGIRHGFRSGPWFVLLVIGGIFLADRIDDDINLRPYLWPIILIGAGTFIIFKPKKNLRHKRGGDWRDTNDEPTSTSYQTYSHTNVASSNIDGAVSDDKDVIDITAIFAGIKKKILSKNFKGGDIVAIMGGTEINLTQADFSGKVMIDSFTMFGGTKLIIPPDWNVQSEVVAIFGGVEDKRPPATNYDPSKIIFLEGTCIFGGIEIKSF